MHLLTLASLHGKVKMQSSTSHSKVLIARSSASFLGIETSKLKGIKPAISKSLLIKNKKLKLINVLGGQILTSKQTKKHSFLCMPSTTFNLKD